MMCKEGLTFDEALTQYVGEFGTGQRKTVFLASLLWLANAFVFFVWVFASLDPVSRHQWRCNDLEDAACMAVLQSSDPKQGFCGLSASQWSWTSTESVVARFNLICQDAWKVQFVNTAMFIGCFFGAGLFGHLNDRFGRRRPLFAATAGIAVCMFGSAAAPNYWCMMALRIITGIGAAGQSQCIMLMSTETTGPSFRGLASVASMSFITLGEFLLVGLAYALPHWRYLTLAAAALNAAGLLLYPFIPESARWLLSKGRKEEAMAVLRNISRSNHTSMPLEPLISGSLTSARNSSSNLVHLDQQAAAVTPVSTINSKDSSPQSDTTSSAAVVITVKPAAADDASIASDSSSVSDCCSDDSSMGLLTLLRDPRLLCRALVLLLTWFTMYFSGYGVVLGSGALPGSVYMTFTMMAAAELTAMLVSAVLVDRLGRHNIITAGLLLGGAACIGAANALGQQTVQAVLAVVGKFGCAMASGVLGTYTTENYPTPVRATAMGMFNQAARCGSIAAPCILMLGALTGPAGGAGALVLPYLAFGSISLAAGVLVLFMPETLGADMPESMEDLQQLQSFFSAKPWQGGWWAMICFLFRTRAVPRQESAEQKLPVAVSKQDGVQQQQQQQQLHQ